MKLIVLLFFGLNLFCVSAQITNEDVIKILEAHNKERKLLNIPNLQWSNELASYAQEWADGLAKIDGDLEHRDHNEYGENIAWYWHEDPSHGVKLWNGEKKVFKYVPISNTNHTIFGHYSQVIWKETTEVGCGVAKGNSGAYFLVCNYNPPGNYIGQKPY